jgi:hypothetical protein
VYAARCNEIATNYDSKTIYQALELSEQAHEVHHLQYVAGLSHLKQFPPVSLIVADFRAGTLAGPEAYYGWTATVGLKF